jgi:hypothetical protein
VLIIVVIGGYGGSILEIDLAHMVRLLLIWLCHFYVGVNVGIVIFNFYFKNEMSVIVIKTY